MFQLLRWCGFIHYTKRDSSNLNALLNRCIEAAKRSKLTKEIAMSLNCTIVPNVRNRSELPTDLDPNVCAVAVDLARSEREEKGTLYAYFFDDGVWSAESRLLTHHVRDEVLVRNYVQNAVTCNVLNVSHDPRITYRKGDVVEGSSEYVDARRYIAHEDVPDGISIDNAAYWTKFSTPIKLETYADITWITPVCGAHELPQMGVVDNSCALDLALSVNGKCFIWMFKNGKWSTSPTELASDTANVSKASYISSLGKVVMYMNVLHDPKREYAEGNVVYSEAGFGYLSLVDVPHNISLSNTYYWIPFYATSSDPKDTIPRCYLATGNAHQQRALPGNAVDGQMCEIESAHGAPSEFYYYLQGEWLLLQAKSDPLTIADAKILISKEYEALLGSLNELLLGFNSATADAYRTGLLNLKTSLLNALENIA